MKITGWKTYSRSYSWNAYVVVNKENGVNKVWPGHVYVQIPGVIIVSYVIKRGPFSLWEFPRKRCLFNRNMYVEGRKRKMRLQSLMMISRWGRKRRGKQSRTD